MVRGIHDYFRKTSTPYLCPFFGSRGLLPHPYRCHYFWYDPLLFLVPLPTCGVWIPVSQVDSDSDSVFWFLLEGGKEWDDNPSIHGTIYWKNSCFLSALNHTSITKTFTSFFIKMFDLGCGVIFHSKSLPSDISWLTSHLHCLKFGSSERLIQLRLGTRFQNRLPLYTGIGSLLLTKSEMTVCRLLLLCTLKFVFQFSYTCAFFFFCEFYLFR